MSDDADALFTVARLCLVDPFYKCRLIGLGLTERHGKRGAELLPFAERLVDDEVDEVAVTARRITSDLS